MVDSQQKLNNLTEKLKQREKRITTIAVAWKQAEIDLYKDLYAEFKDDLPKWNAELEKDTLLIRFKSPEVLFDQGEDNIKPKFVKILAAI